MPVSAEVCEAIYIVTGETRCAGYLCPKMGWFTSNLLYPHHYRDSKVFRVWSHEFGMVRLYQTSSSYIATGITRCAGCFCTRSGWFKHIEPHHYRDRKVCRVLSRSGWFNCTDTDDEGLLFYKMPLKVSVFCASESFWRGGSTVPNLLYLHRYRRNKVCRVLMH